MNASASTTIPSGLGIGVRPVIDYFSIAGLCGATNCAFSNGLWPQSRPSFACRCGSARPDVALGQWGGRPREIILVDARWPSDRVMSGQPGGPTTASCQQ